MLSRNPADNVAVESKHTEIYIVCQVQEESKTPEKQKITSIKKKKKMEPFGSIAANQSSGRCHQPVGAQ